MLKDRIAKQLSECVCFAEEDDKNIGLPYPYSVPTPGNTFRALFYWDTYFTNLGLLCSGNVQQAKQNVDDMLYLVERYGFMPNGSQKWYLSRSQPPFLSMMVYDVFENIRDMEWLQSAYDGLKKEYQFWMENRTAPNGLAHYGYTPTDPTMENWGEKWNARTNSKAPVTGFELTGNYLAQAESGWDFTPRFGVRGQYICCPDLNALLWQLESNMAFFAEVLDNGEASEWSRRKHERADKMNSILWQEDAGCFADVDYVTGEVGTVFSIAAYYPMFVGMATEEQAKRTMERIAELEHPFGVCPCGEHTMPGTFQWAAPNVWPCLQWVMYKAMRNYGFHGDAERIAQKYINVIEENEEKTGQLWEKYNADTGGCDAACEYKTPPMLGWTAGVYLKLLQDMKKCETKERIKP